MKNATKSPSSRRSRRYALESHGPKNCVLRVFDDDCGLGPVGTREFFTRGSYVWERGTERDRQVCDRLRLYGETLMHRGKPLIDVIRPEVQRAVYDARRSPYEIR